MNLIDDLNYRGLIQQYSNEESVKKIPELAPKD